MMHSAWAVWLSILIAVCGGAPPIVRPGGALPSVREAVLIGSEVEVASADWQGTSWWRLARGSPGIGL